MMNVYEMEKLMQMRQAELEEVSREAWKRERGKKRRNLFSFIGDKT